MGKVFWATVGLLLVPLVATAQEPINWQPTLDSAMRLATQTNRPVLIHFWADWCRVCREMERDVFGQPRIASVLQDNYVAVKINADHFPTTCRQYGITALPTDVIISPQGQQIDRLQGLLGASDYAGRLERVAAAMRRPAGQLYAQAPAAEARTVAGPSYPPPGGAGYQPPYVEHYVEQTPNQPYAGNYTPQGQPPGGSGRVLQPVESASPALPPRPQAPMANLAAPASAGQPPLGSDPYGNPPLGLDGFCPVQLIDNMRADVQQWTLGDRRWGVIHRGRTYLFAGPEQRDRFLADPDRYAPVLSGNDVVVAVEEGKAVTGDRRHGMLFAGQIYLFASEATLARFSQDPQRYAREVLQALQAEAERRQRLR